MRCRAALVVGAHANVGGGYAGDLLVQIPLKWFIAKATALGHKLRWDVDIDQANVVPRISDS
ncbi:hypothetical protein MES5069_800017 [Mesorhizobium escarrei]|uniref:Uncharacterized protein n=1 Tax=Mesorhizobium escarrei TaxID=666018 RepID=A0ABM9EIW3_9HYPH|nr:hypothetical protein MES5069_800017 [Mesorhizobium escarrei]